MKNIIIIPALLAILIMAGCWALSIHPLYTDKDLITDPMLIGQWYDPNEQNQLWVFEQAGENGYRLTIIGEEIESQLKKAVQDKEQLVVTVDPEKDGLFEMHMVLLEKDTLMDFFPVEPENPNEFLMSHLIPAHSFALVSVQGNVMLISLFDGEWLKKGLDEGTLSIKHESTEGITVLTADTDELQRFILDHIDEAFEKPLELHRL